MGRTRVGDVGRQSLRYKVELTVAVRAFLNGLHEDDKQAVRVLLNAIGEAPELGNPVQALDNVFYQKTYWLNRQRHLGSQSAVEI